MNNRPKRAKLQKSGEAAFAQAVQLVRQRRLADADKVCRKILAKDVLNKQATHLRAVIAQLSGDTGLAVERMERLAKFRPDDPGIWHDLGAYLSADSRLADAITAFDKAIALDPKFAEAHLGKGRAYLRSRDLVPARKSLDAALDANPKLVVALDLLCNVLLDLGEIEEAENQIQLYINSAPNKPESHLHLGRLYEEQGFQKEAQLAFLDAIRLSHEAPQISVSYAGHLARVGRLEEAIGLCQEVMSKHPEYGGALFELARYKRFTSQDSDFEKLKDWAERTDIPRETQARAAFALAKALEDIGAYQDAFGHYQNGNQIQRKIVVYDRTSVEQLTCDIVETFNQNVLSGFSNAGFEDDTPIFIVGLPRSGTSLVEQILASHRDVAGGGELPNVRILTDELFAELDTRSFSQLLPNLTSERLRHWGEQYISKLRRCSADARYITDKSPINFFHIGLLSVALPSARFVNVRRDPLDNCLAIYKTMFGVGIAPYGYDVDELAHFIQCRDRLLTHWNTVLPDRIYTIDYEKLVANQEMETRNLLNACNLEWDDACLEFYSTKRVVRTASIAQVRRPIYQSSSGISEKFGDALAPLRAALQRNQMSNSRS